LEDKVEVEQRISVLNIALKSSPARWRATHKEDLISWDEIKLALQYLFILPPQVI
jgi:hypothetical protein